MHYPNKIAVSSRTFSNTPDLVTELEEYFEVVKLNKNDKLTGKDLAHFIGDSEGLIVGLEEINEEVLSGCPNLKIVAKYGVGLDNLDIEACKKRGVYIGWTGGTNRLSVAEMTLGFMLALSRNLYQTSTKLKSGIWDKNGGHDLSGRTIGIIGVGNVGKEVIRLLKPFNCRILANDIIDQSDYYNMVGVQSAEKQDLYKESDIITLHLPLNQDTRHLINKTALASMRDGAYIVNTARGPIVDYSALKDALKSGKLAGAAIDVYDDEPPTDKDLLSLPNLICTPHIGGNSREAVMAMGRSAIHHLKEYFEQNNE